MHHEKFQIEIRKLLELDEYYEDPENELDNFDLGDMSLSDLAWHFFKMGMAMKI